MKRGVTSLTITLKYNGFETDGVDYIIENLNEGELRDLLLELKFATQKISEAIVEKSKSNEKLDVDQARVVTNWIKKGNDEKAIQSHMFFIDSTKEEAEKYVNTVKERLEL